MAFQIAEAQQYLKAFDFRTLFREVLGWDRFNTSLPVKVDGESYTLEPVAEKKQVVVLLHTGRGSVLPADKRSKVETEVAKSYREHILIFIDDRKRQQVWQWVRREPGRPLRRREFRFDQGQTGEALAQRLAGIEFSLEEEDDLNLVEVTGRLRAAFDLERATRRFYDQFRRERDAFEKFLAGIPDADMARWYVSVMLNRLMFIYFIQKKGFLDNDHDYLRHKLQQSQAQADNRFYRDFLCPLFFQGFAWPENSRSVAMQQLLGRVPYLNGGIFEKHEVEEQHGQTIQIPDAAFGRLFDFFDQYQWHLDDRPLRDDREINPDVLGYIFEKYINQKQMGAYYTREDITGYISRNSILPFLFDEARKRCQVAFEGESAVWSLLPADPDRYIYEAVRKGVERALPAEIEAGVEDVSRRGLWNTPTPADYALPTEIWRETVARRQRYEEVRAKIAAGEIRAINDFITYNLDIQQFAQDVIETCEGADLLQAFWEALNQVSILDPTCGSGAFLFAALNILEPLYEACIARMTAFLAEPEWKRLHPRYSERFGKVLAKMERHPNQTYFIYKSIVVNNLYGVDIMPEAAEIAKLRLFLKLVAQVERYEDIEPLPDIDFNIRAGNTLVGFTTITEVVKAMRSRLLFGEEAATLRQIEEKAVDIDRLFSRFRDMQTGQELEDYLPQDFTDAKEKLKRRLKALEEELNGYLARQRGVEPHTPAEYRKWLASHQPFHWFIEYYGILKQGGIDVVIGNPPYVTYGKNFDYRVTDYFTESCADLYAFVMERAIKVMNPEGRIGVIIPVSSVSTDGFGSLRDFLYSNLANSWVSSFAERPSKLFTGVEKRLTIWLGQAAKSKERHNTYVSKYRRWFAEERDNLFSLLQYVLYNGEYQLVSTAIPKIYSTTENNILARLSSERPLNYFFMKSTNHIVYYTRKLRYFVQFFDFIPKITNDKGKVIPPSELKTLYLPSSASKDALAAILNSSLFFWFLTVHSDVRNVNRREIECFRCSIDAMDASALESLVELAQELMQDFQTNSKIITNNYQKYGTLHIQSFQPRESKPIIDQIDKVLAEHFNFDAEEFDFIVNYDVKYRMGDSLLEDEEGDGE